MSVDDMRTLLQAAVADVHADPDLGQAIVRRHRHSRRRLIPLVAVASAVLVVLGLVGVTVAVTRSKQSAAETPASGERAPTPGLPVGPDGPVFFSGGGRSLLVGKVHALGPTTAADGRKALTLVLFVEFTTPTNVPRSVRLNACSTRWVPGTALADAVIDRCVGGNPGDDEPPVDGPAALLRPPDDAGAQRFMRLSKATARAEVKLGLASEQRAHATPEGGDAPVRLRQPVTLLGADDPAAPQLIGVVPPTPSGYVYLGTDSWDGSGRQILNTRRGNYCGPDPQRPTAPFESCLH